jgi:hypothetical protein
MLREAKNLYPKDHARGTGFFASLRMTTSWLVRRWVVFTLIKPSMLLA